VVAAIGGLRTAGGRARPSPFSPPHLALPSRPPQTLQGARNHPIARSPFLESKNLGKKKQSHLRPKKRIPTAGAAASGVERSHVHEY
jgi:hypothetical protein